MIRTDTSPGDTSNTDNTRSENAQARLAAIVTASADAIISKTLEGIVTSWNAAAMRIFGYTPEEMLGQSIRRLIPPHLQAEEDMILSKIVAGERLEHYETVRLTKEGRLIDVSVTVSPLHDATGKIIGASKIARDITDRKAAEDRISSIRDALSVEPRATDPHELAETMALPPMSQTVADRDLAVATIGLLESKSERSFDQTTRLAAGVIQAPTALLTVLDGDRQVFVGAYGLPSGIRETRAMPAALSYCRLAIDSGVAVSIRNARTNPLVTDMQMWREGMVSYLGVPIFDRHGTVIAALSVSDSKPRAWTLRDLLTLKGVAQQLMRELENRVVLRTLAESEERLRAASTAAGFGIHDTRVATGKTNWSSELVRMLGLGSSGMTVPAIEAIVATAHPDDKADVARKLNDVMHRAGAYEYECRIVRPDGAVRWILDRGEAIGPVHPVSGFVARITGVVLDITERKQHEEKVFLLMREVNHRAKNMLGLVQAMARQMLASEPVDFVARFSERIHALSANQDLLVKNEWEGVDIADLVNAQLATFEDLIGRRILLSGPPVRLTAAAAQGIGLALHELCTNAGKYGALSNDTGCVTVVWEQKPDEFSISWKESGGPPVSPPTRKGFGSTIITYAAETSVDGSTELDYAPDGLRWTLRCPAKNVVDPYGGARRSTTPTF